MPISLTRQRPDSGLSIFSAMSQSAVEHNAVNLSRGFPDFEVSPVLIDRLRLQSAPKVQPIRPMTGATTLREAIAAKIANLYDADCDPGLGPCARSSQR